MLKFRSSVVFYIILWVFRWYQWAREWILGEVSGLWFLYSVVMTESFNGVEMFLYIIVGEINFVSVNNSLLIDFCELSRTNFTLDSIRTYNRRRFQKNIFKSVHKFRCEDVAIRHMFCILLSAPGHPVFRWSI